MATDATGAPTAKGIPKYNPAVDKPSGLGFNAAMDTLDALFSDRVTTAVTTLLANKLLVGDAQPSFKILGDGKHQWGPGGGTAPDTNLIRAASGVLQPDGIRLGDAGRGIDVLISNSIVETNVHTFSIPANTLVSGGRVVQTYIPFYMTNNTGGAATVTWRFKLAGTTFIADGIIPATAVNPRPGIIRVLTAWAGTNVVRMFAEASVAISAAPGVGGAGTLNGTVFLGGAIISNEITTLTVTNPITFDATVQLSAASVNLAVDVRHAFSTIL